MPSAETGRKRHPTETRKPDPVSTAAKKKRSSFLADCELWIDLPDLPNDSKLLRYPLGTDRLYAFCASSLEIRSKAEYFPETDLGIHIEAIDPSAYAFSSSSVPVMDRDDEYILSLARDCIKADRATMARRREQFQQEFPVARWFRKPEIMSNSLFTSAPAKRDAETPKPSRVQKTLDAHSVLQQIEESFIQHRGRLVHSTNPNLEPVSVLPIYPHDDLVGVSFSHIMFDRPTVRAGTACGAAQSDAVLLGSSQSRLKDYYVSGSDDSPDSKLDWSARYMQTLSDTNPENKDRLFFLLTPSAVLFGHLSSRESLQKVLNIDSLSEEERVKIPSSVILSDAAQST